MTNEPKELHLKYRPVLFKEVIGQPQAVSVLKQMLQDKRLPHALLFTGPSGTGKTTLARLVSKKLGCNEGDFQEINAADFNGIDMIRSMRTRAMLHPLHGTCRVFIVDEAHAISKEGQSALLKILEDTPQHVYFFLATTDPAKMLKTVTSRCTEIKVKEMTDAYQKQLLESVCAQASITIKEEVANKIVECAGGSARSALVLLNKIVGIDAAEQLDVIERNASQQQGIGLARALLNRQPWTKVAALLKTIDEDPEALRWMVLTYMSSVMLNTGPASPRAYEILKEFQFNFWDSKKAGLVQACYVLSQKR
jgi:DNA polymerase III gamma/tau subunit